MEELNLTKVVERKEDLPSGFASDQFMAYLEWVPDCWGEESYPRCIQTDKYFVFVVFTEIYGLVYKHS